MQSKYGAWKRQIEEKFYIEIINGKNMSMQLGKKILKIVIC